MTNSAYNYILPYNGKHIIFNGISQKFFVTTDRHIEDYIRLIENPDSNLETYGAFIGRLQKSGFVIDDTSDERQLIVEKISKLRRPEMYFLMILPTYQCNLRCRYCIQDHEDLLMTDQTASRLKKLIENKLNDRALSHLHLSWFGGEPLMAYQRVLDITKYAQEQALKHNKTFTAHITTNGTLLTSERIEALREAGVTNYQITIDGDRETHNSVKKLGNISAYDRTLDNIRIIAGHTQVNLRFNYTRDNLHPKEIINNLKEKLGDKKVQNIRFSLFKVWQEERNHIDSGEVDNLFDMGKAIGMTPELGGIGLCYADQLNYDCVFPNGKVGKCDNRSLHEMPGTLEADGSISWLPGTERLHNLHLFGALQQECSSCGYLPFCLGPCVAKRENMLQAHNRVTCQYSDKEASMKEAIINYCKTHLQKASDF